MQHASIYALTFVKYRRSNMQQLGGTSISYVKTVVINLRAVSAANITTYLARGGRHIVASYQT
jgi:hypothetical protein